MNKLLFLLVIPFFLCGSTIITLEDYTDHNVVGDTTIYSDSVNIADFTQMIVYYNVSQMVSAGDSISFSFESRDPTSGNFGALPDTGLASVEPTANGGYLIAEGLTIKDLREPFGDYVRMVSLIDGSDSVAFTVTLILKR